MEQARWTLHDAKNRFSAVVNAAQHGQPQLVTKHGAPAVVVVSIEEYQAYLSIARKQQPSFDEYLLSIPRSDIEFERMEPCLRDLKK
jgi:prevent-host-death family protein